MVSTQENPLGWYIVDVAHLPARRNQEPTNLHYALADALAEGKSPPELARLLAKGDKAKAKRLRKRFRHMLQSDEIAQAVIFARAREAAVVHLPAAIEAAGRRASKGNIPAAKFVAEATSFHNPRIRHEHSGTIEVKLDMPRPAFDAESRVEGLADAEVVE